MLKSIIAKDFKDLQIFEAVENVVLFTKKMVNAESVVIWFEDEERDSFWSYQEKVQIFLQKDIIEPLLGDRINLYLTKDSHLGFISELEKLPFHSKIENIKNVMFYRVFCEKANASILIECLNINSLDVPVKKDLNEILNILSMFVVQTIKIKDISTLAKYYFEEQEKAYIKQKTVIQNDLESSSSISVSIFYEPSDILNGDTYSIYRTSNGDILVYLIDAMGHGIAPSLTAYSVSAIIQHKIKSSPTFHELMESILDNIQYILTDEEQLTCGFFWFSNDLSKVDYVVAGMYAPMILDGEKVISAKANNIPFMNFAFDFSITTIELKDFQKFLMFTDGLIEDTQDLEVDIDRILKDDFYSEDIFNKLSGIDLEDDTTIIKLSRK
jgi:hypothetical protein